MRVVLTRREALDCPDGVNIFIVSCAQAMAEMGHEVKIVVGSLQSDVEYRRLLAPHLDLPILALSRTPVTGLASARAWLRGKRAIDQFKPDLVLHSEAVPLPLPGTIVHIVHSLEPRKGPLAPLWRSIRRFSTRHSTYVVATTRELHDELLRNLGIPQHQLVLIPKCVDLQAYRRTELAGRQRAILHSGTLPYKDPGATIRAFGALDDASAELYIAGDVTGPTQQAVDTLPDRLRRRVSLLGPADGQIVKSLYSRVRVAAFPTRYAIPVASATVMEAIATGTPIVGSPQLSRDVLEDGVNGLVVERDPGAMAIALRALLNDDAIWSRLSAGAGHMAERFDAFRVGRQYIQLASTRDSQQRQSWKRGSPARRRA